MLLSTWQFAALWMHGLITMPCGHVWQFLNSMIIFNYGPKKIITSEIGKIRHFPPVHIRCYSMLYFGDIAQYIHWQFKHTAHFYACIVERWLSFSSWTASVTSEITSCSNFINSLHLDYKHTRESSALWHCWLGTSSSKGIWPVKKTTKSCWYAGVMIWLELLMS